MTAAEVEPCTCETCRPTRAPGDHAPRTDPQWAEIDEAITESLREALQDVADPP